MLLGIREDGEAERMSEASVFSIERNISNVVDDSNLFNFSPPVEFDRRRCLEGGFVYRSGWHVPVPLDVRRDSV